MTERGGQVEKTKTERYLDYQSLPSLTFTSEGGDKAT
jgi:hypothetical protein